MRTFFSPIRSALLIAMIAILSWLLSGRSMAGETQPDRRLATHKVTFEHDIQPLLTRYGCNSGPCHGKARDRMALPFRYSASTRISITTLWCINRGGRRISPDSPDGSLLLQKALGQLPHGGGARFDADSQPHQLLRAWIANGGVRTPADAPQLVRVTVEPQSKSLTPQASFALQVRAEYSDGSHRDVTDVSAFQSNDSTIVGVGEGGELKAGPVPGETAVMARYMNHIAVCAVTIPLPGTVATHVYEGLPQTHPIDVLVWDKLKLLGMLPSVKTDDATFQRRAYLRVIGRLPTPDETRYFLEDKDAGKRPKLIDRLLERPSMQIFGPINGRICYVPIRIALASKRPGRWTLGCGRRFARTCGTTSLYAS